MKQFILALLFVMYCIIFHTNKSNPTFAPPCLPPVDSVSLESLTNAPPHFFCPLLFLMEVSCKSYWGPLVHGESVSLSAFEILLVSPEHPSIFTMFQCLNLFEFILLLGCLY